MILVDGVKYELWKPQKEEMLEEIVIEHSKEIWGANSLYFEKKKLRTGAGKVSIPDGFVVIFESRPHWHIVEVELSSHPLWEHVFPQISKFAASITNEATRRGIVDMIDTILSGDEVTRAWVKSKVAPLEIYKFLTALIGTRPTLSIIVDEKTRQLEELLSQLPPKFEEVKVMELKTFLREGCDLAVHAHLFEPLHEPVITEPGKEPRAIIEVPEISLEEVLQNASPETRHLALSLRQRILVLGRGIKESPGKWWIDFRKSSTFVSLNIQKKKLVVFIKMGDHPVDDPKGITSRVSWYGRLNTRFNLSPPDDLDYAMHLIKQAYDYVPW